MSHASEILVGTLLGVAAGYLIGVLMFWQPEPRPIILPATPIVIIVTPTAPPITAGPATRRTQP